MSCFCQIKYLLLSLTYKQQIMKKQSLMQLREDISMLAFAALIAATSIVYGCRKSTDVVNLKAPTETRVAVRD
jgi:hypothetical protein